MTSSQVVARVGPAKLENCSAPGVWNLRGEGCAHKVCSGEDGKCSGWDGRRRVRGPASRSGQKRSRGVSESPAVTKLSSVMSPSPCLGSYHILEWSEFPASFTSLGAPRRQEPCIHSYIHSFHKYLLRHSFARDGH